jgi:hypothetical protein
MAALLARTLVLAAMLAPPCLAQQVPHDSTPPVVLETIEVTTERRRAAPPPELVVDVPGREVRKEQSANAYDLVRRAAGLEVHEQGQGPGWASDVVIRGFTSDHSSDVLLVLDGVPVNLPVHGHVEGYADWTILSPAAVQSLRVIHGPASALYGNFAFAGVVEVNTSADATRTAASVGGSSNGDVGGWIRTGHRGPNGGSLLAFDGRRDQGWRDNSSSWLGNLLLRGWRRVGTRSRLEGGLATYAADWQSPGFLSVADFNANQLTRAADPTDGGSGGRVILHGTLVQPVGEGSEVDVLGWVQAARSTVFLTLSDDGTLAQQEERDRRGAAGMSASWRKSVGLGDVAVGIDGRADWDTYGLYRTNRRARDITLQLNDGRYQQGGAYARWRGFLFGRLQYDFGLRGDAIRVNARDRVTAGAAFQDKVHTVALPKAGVRVLLGGPWSAIASVGRGFRSAIGTITNPEQPLVTEWSEEVGVQLRSERTNAQLSLFQTNTRNERIQNPVTLQVSDAGTSRRRGVSASVGVALGSRVRVSAEGTFNDAKITGAADGVASPLVPLLDRVPRPSFHDEPLTPGATVPGVSRYLGRTELAVQATPALEGRVLVRWSGPFTPIGEPTVRTSGYVIADLGASVGVRRWGTFDIELQNVFGTRYPEIRASGYINPGERRTLRASLRLPVTTS